MTAKRRIDWELVLALAAVPAFWQLAAHADDAGPVGHFCVISIFVWVVAGIFFGGVALMGLATNELYSEDDRWQWKLLVFIWLPWWLLLGLAGGAAYYLAKGAYMTVTRPVQE